MLVLTIAACWLGGYFCGMGVFVVRWCHGHMSVGQVFSIMAVGSFTVAMFFCMWKFLGFLC